MKRCLIIMLYVLGLALSAAAAYAQSTTVLAPDSRAKGQLWSYTLAKPQANWTSSDFDEKNWKKGQGGFGRNGTPGSVVRTNWHSPEIWLRRSFTVKTMPKQLAIDIHHDEDAEVYLNGTRVLAVTGYLVDYRRYLLDASALSALKVGNNVIAVHCRQTGGGQYIDVGLTADPKGAGTPVQTAKQPNLPPPLDPTSPIAIRFYEKDVKSVLEQSCLKCHGAGRRLRGGLNLTHRPSLLKGGDTEPAVNLENPLQSKLLAMVSYKDEHHQMPPKGKLPQKQLDILKRWVQMGAPMTPGAGKVVKDEQSPLITESAKNYWAYRKLARPPVPRVADAKWVRNPIDAFLLAQMEPRELSPAKPLDKAKLIRRATYDLTGLPPAPEEVKEFVADKSPKAYENLLDRLLKSPHYGEKWGRHWLDLVRYAETCGYEFDQTKPNAWRYRDYVVKSFNQDKPYDRFIIEQLAGDEIEGTNDETRMATLFYRLGVFDTAAPDGLQRDFDVYDDIVKTTSEVMLGMTVGCARCHDHKKDPIPQADYYRLLAFVRNIRPAHANPVAEHGRNSQPTHILVRGSAHARGKQVEPGYPQVLGFEDPKTFAKSSANTAGRRLTLAKWITSEENPLTARVMANRIWQHHFGRGIVPTPSDFGKLGRPPTHPKLLDWLAAEFMKRNWSIKSMHKLIMTSSAYRMSAHTTKKSEILDPDNAFFSRFAIRRLSAEELRDSVLAIDGTLDRKIGGPSVYPSLPQEVVRTSSKFDRRTGFIGAGFWQRPRPEYEVRRSIYTFVRRSLLPPMLASFDLADTDNSCAVRFTTTVPTQALTLLNSKFMHDHAKLFAERLKREAGDKTADQVRRSLELVTQREPKEKEINRGVRLIADLQSAGISEERALQNWCLVALNLNEFVYLD